MKIQIDPIPKPRMTKSDKWKKRPCVLRYWGFKEWLKKFDLKHDNGQIAITFNIKMPKSWSKKKKDEMNGQPHQQKPDIDNLVKAYMDAVLDEDKHIYQIFADKYWSHHGSIEVHQETQS